MSLARQDTKRKSFVRVKPTVWPFAKVPTLTVHATVSEPLPLLCAFVAHYVALGADHVLLSLDHPNPVAERVLGAIPQVQITVCDTPYWRSSLLRQRPALHPERQRYNANQAYQTCKTDWFLFCDADEFLHVNGNFKKALRGVDASVPFLRFAVAERAERAGAESDTIFDGVFRTAITDFITQGGPIYGEDTYFLNDGLVGHTRGKAITRTGQNLRIGLHHPEPPQPQVGQTKAKRRGPLENYMSDAWILHFDGLTALHRALKLAIKTRDTTSDNAVRRHRGRLRQMQLLDVATDKSAAIAQLAALSEISAKQVDQLTALDALRTFRPNLAQTAKQLFPNAGLDFSPAAFDQHLKALHPDLIAQAGLAP